MSVYLWTIFLDKNRTIFLAALLLWIEVFRERTFFLIHRGDFNLFKAQHEHFTWRTGHGIISIRQIPTWFELDIYICAWHLSGDPVEPSEPSAVLAHMCLALGYPTAAPGLAVPWKFPHRQISIEGLREHSDARHGTHGHVLVGTRCQMIFFHILLQYPSKLMSSMCFLII